MRALRVKQNPFLLVVEVEKMFPCKCFRGFHLHPRLFVRCPASRSLRCSSGFITSCWNIFGTQIGSANVVQCAAWAAKTGAYGSSSPSTLNLRCRTNPTAPLCFLWKKKGLSWVVWWKFELRNVSDVRNQGGGVWLPKREVSEAIFRFHLINILIFCPWKFCRDCFSGKI